jgi:hypothetical protein
MPKATAVARLERIIEIFGEFVESLIMCLMD